MSLSAFSDSLDSSSPVPNRRHPPLPRGILAFFTLTALATFFGGYFLREIVSKRAGAGDDFSNARVLELVVAYAPDNPMALNDLAALYLIPDERGGTSRPLRALDLAERALEFTREPLILDTAAEAQFQCGHVREAIRLEGESLGKTLGLGPRPKTPATTTAEISAAATSSRTAKTRGSLSVQLALAG